MKNYSTVLLIMILIMVESISSQSITSKRDFRGAWVATVINLDWPSSNTLSTAQQKEELITLFDKLEQTNINAVIFQIRTECDALYASNYDPWSHWLTGTQGKAPNPYYDPLQFAISEAHSRGMELHAWFNPYRVERDAGNYTTAANHVSNLHPEWTLQIGDIKFLNPGLPLVREYVNNVVMDVVNRYDVDGVHFDDYFYPYPPDEISTQDQETFAEFNRGFFNIKDWRRDNINELLRIIHDSIQVVKPHVKFGMSPFGIYKNGVPSGISGLDAFNTIYCDPIAWLNEEIIDYLTPQLYWQFGGGQDYGKLLPWWAQQVGNRHLYPGQALYRAASFPQNEIPRQLRLNRETSNVYGNIFFRAENLFGNPNGVTDSLENYYFKNKSLAPQMSWKDSVKPNNPMNLRFESLAEMRGEGLVWDPPVEAVDGDSASMYVVYQLDGLEVSESDIENAENIWKVQNRRTATLNSSDRVSDKMYFTVTSLDKNSNESQSSNVVEVSINIPEVPLLVGPIDNSLNQRDTTLLYWNNSLHSSSNRLQVSNDSLFSDLVFDKTGIIDTFYAITNLNGLSKYYWRVSAKNIAGESEYSLVNTFTTGFPEAIVLVSPEDKSTEVSIEPQLFWNNSSSSISYNLQVAEGLSIEPSIIVIDTVVVDTMITIAGLTPNKIYSWHVRGVNEYGNGNWSEISKFKTELLSSLHDELVPLTFSLEQNYPNPFNPETIIKFSLPEQRFTTLKIYDMLGREVENLISKELSAGNYEFTFTAKNYASGMYLYVLNNGKSVLSKKMMLLK